MLWSQSLSLDDPAQELLEFDSRLLERLLGMALVWYMPDHGLEEAVSVLKDTFDFYSEDVRPWESGTSEAYVARFLEETEAPLIYLTEP